MKAIIDGKRYDTETAAAICEGSYNGPRSDFAWWEATLYRTKGGAYFLAGRGGPASGFAEPAYGGGRTGGEGILPRDAREAMDFAAEHGGAEVVEHHFGDLVEDARGPGRPEIGPATQIRLPQEMMDDLDAIAERDHVSRAEVIRRLVASGMYAPGLDRCQVWTGEPGKTVLDFVLREPAWGELEGEIKLSLTEIPGMPIIAGVQRDGRNAERGEFASVTEALEWAKGLPID